jgi:hypothetical protein
LPAAAFARLRARVGRVGRERLSATYRTTFWFALGDAPSNVVEEAVVALRRLVPRARVAGVEWWLSRMRTTDVQVDFHRDRDERLALAGGPEVHPCWSAVLFLNRVRGGCLAVTAEPPNLENPACAPDRLALDLVMPRPNRLAVFPGGATHGVLDARNRVPEGRLPGRSRLRIAVVMNFWPRRPLGVPSFGGRAYRALATSRAPAPAPPARAANPPPASATRRSSSAR